jgi:hypothetical protein
MVYTRSRGFHQGFSCGLNVAVAANVVFESMLDKMMFGMLCSCNDKLYRLPITRLPLFMSRRPDNPTSSKCGWTAIL